MVYLSSIPNFIVRRRTQPEEVTGTTSVRCLGLFVVVYKIVTVVLTNMSWYTTPVHQVVLDVV